SLGQDNKEVFSQPSQVTVVIPPKVEKVVTQVSQHIPIVLTQHLANQQRLVRSLDNRRNLKTEGSQKCNFICNPLDVTVCGYNGRCYREFENQCELTIYNCLNTQKIDEANCQNVSFPKCFRGDIFPSSSFWFLQAFKNKY
ncbi:hypothetical protein FF38_13220, partial [Lucilia cuprina]